ncbi:hypothetical protein [Streptomyces pinistramenti]|uniref:hypothetical protein n=1 Tax=Streptomyces pinistramenti TaxID=2884812 RepID=UPI001D05FE73|nr:hypothetical protein [Streptomyces pinistramenti]MCB5906106.1 hypothetical protein [Streptomyces pinistramenti]
MGAQVTKQEQDIKNALVLLEGQMQAMRTAGQKVEDTVQQAAQHFHSTASTTFQQKMQEWIETYNQASAKVNNLHASLEAANQTLNTGDSQAQEHAAGWSGDIDGIHGVLSGGGSSS